MAETTWAALRALLVDRYDLIRARLTRQLGSEELASESLHETWLHLQRNDDLGPVQRPLAYLIHIATNIAKDTHRREHRRLRRSEIDAVLEIPDPAPGPAQIAEARLELEALDQAVRELPERARAILIASRVEGLTHQQIADRLGVSRRTVLYELRRAIEQLHARLNQRDAGDCTPKPPKTS